MSSALDARERRGLCFLLVDFGVQEENHPLSQGSQHDGEKERAQMAGYFKLARQRDRMTLGHPGIFEYPEAPELSPSPCPVSDHNSVWSSGLPSLCSIDYLDDLTLASSQHLLDPCVVGDEAGTLSVVGMCWRPGTCTGKWCL